MAKRDKGGSCGSRVRFASSDDLDAILEIDGLRVGEVGEASIIQAVAQGRCLVALVAGDVLGIATYEPERFFGRDFVPFVYVGPRSRGQGVARQLLEFLVSLDGTGDLFTSTNESNLPMRRLLESGGWLFSGRLNGLDEEDPELVYFYRR